MKSTLLCFALLAPRLLIAQEESREIWDTGFLQKRPPATTSGVQPRSQTKIHYRLATPPERQTISSEATIGLTVWRLRLPESQDVNNARLLVQDMSGGPSTEFVPERIRLTDVLKSGDRIRLAIEVPRHGYLYVIDRERYNDGSFGDPYLIFPTLNMNHGENTVESGRMIEIPSQTGPVRALRVERHGNRHIGEDLMVLVTQKPIENLVPAEGEQKLSSVLINQWEKDWSAVPLRLDLEGTEHQAWTPAEKKAGASNSYLLTQSDPMPGSIFSVSSPVEKPLLVHVSLEIQ